MQQAHCILFSQYLTYVKHNAILVKIIKMSRLKMQIIEYKLKNNDGKFLGVRAHRLVVTAFGDTWPNLDAIGLDIKKYGSISHYDYNTRQTTYFELKTEFVIVKCITNLEDTLINPKELADESLRRDIFLKNKTINFKSFYNRLVKEHKLNEYRWSLIFNSEIIYSDEFKKALNKSIGKNEYKIKRKSRNAVFVFKSKANLMLAKLMCPIDNTICCDMVELRDI